MLSSEGPCGKQISCIESSLYLGDKSFKNLRFSLYEGSPVGRHQLLMGKQP